MSAFDREDARSGAATQALRTPEIRREGSARRRTMPPRAPRDRRRHGACLLVVLAWSLAGCGGGGGAAVAPTYSISGAVTDASSGAPLTGASIVLAGAAAASTTTDASGKYSFSGLSSGSYSVTPVLAEYTFNPSGQSVTVNGASIAGQNFAATRTTYAISGAVTNALSGRARAGVSMALAGPASATVTTDVNGEYSVPGLYDGSYSVTPDSAGVSFSPASQLATVKGADVSGENFLATQIATVASGIGFLPGAFSSANQLRASLVVTGGGAFFTDSSDAPLKKTTLSDLVTTALARRMGTPESVVIYGQNVFWVDGGKLYETSLDGASTTLLASGTRDPVAGATSDIAVDGSAVYWVNTVSSPSCSPSCIWHIQRVPFDGTPPVTVATANRHVVALASDASNLYWEEASLEPVAVGCQCGSSIKTVPKGGGATVLLVDGLLNGPPPNLGPGYLPGSWMPAGGLAVAGSAVFFGVSGYYGLTGYQVSSVPTSGGAVSALASVASSAIDALNAIRSISVAGAVVYWIDMVSGTLDAVPVAGGSVTIIASGIKITDLNHPSSLAITAGSAYWTEPGSYAGCCLQAGTGSLKSVPVSGGAASTVTGGLDGPGALAADASNIVWTEAWRVARAPVAGGAATTLASGISSDMARIAADQKNVYVLDGDFIKKVSVNGGAVERVSPAHGTIGDISVQDQDIATDGVNLYWTVSGLLAGPVVQQVAVTGGPVLTLALPQTMPMGGGQQCYWRIAVDAQNVYWTSASSTVQSGCTIEKVAIGGGAATALVDAAGLQDFTVDGTYLYFSNLQLGSIEEMPVGGGAMTPVAAAAGWVLANDGRNVYWMDRSGGIGLIAKSLVASGAAPFYVPLPLATNPMLAIEGIAVDQGSLYVTETPAGHVYSIK